MDDYLAKTPRYKRPVGGESTVSARADRYLFTLIGVCRCVVGGVVPRLASTNGFRAPQIISSMDHTKCTVRSEVPGAVPLSPMAPTHVPTLLDSLSLAVSRASELSRWIDFLAQFARRMVLRRYRRGSRRSRGGPLSDVETRHARSISVRTDTFANTRLHVTPR